MAAPNSKVPLFLPGRIMMTPGALVALATANVAPESLLFRHMTGDWGNLVEEDRLENDRALGNGTRIFSSYLLPTGEKIWLITEADRSATTFLLPMEY